MARKKTLEPAIVEPVEITPEDSVVPVYLIPLTAEEEAEREQWVIEQAEREAQAQAEAEAKTVARENALAKLADLGLTLEEIEAITS